MTESVDIMVLGATGFTGQYVVKELTLISKESEYSGLTWGIAGRSQEKLKKIITELHRTGVNTLQLPVLVCDVMDEESLKQTCSSAKVIMNCTGPCSEYSERIVKACIEARTHYVDISAELHHMLKIYRTYHNDAKEANVLIICACGFGSIPAVMGLMHLEKNFQGTLQAVECYATIDIPKRTYIPGPNKCLVHYGTWASLVHELKNFSEYSDMKKKTFPEAIYETEPAKIKKSFFHRKEGKVWFPYPGPDSDIVDMTQRYFQEKEGTKPFHFKIYTSMPLLLHLILLVPAFFCYYWLCRMKCFRNLLWKHPKFFTLGYMSRKGPTEETMNDTKYSFNLTGTGWDKGKDENTPPTKKMTLKVFGSDPGYKTTASAFVLSAVTILKDSFVMPMGGVLTTGVAFRDTKLVDRLKTRNVNFEFV